MTTFLADTVGLNQIVQDRSLARITGEALFPHLLWRAGVPRAPWEGGIGQTQTFTNPGLIKPNTRARKPGTTPAYATLQYEKYTATVQRYGNGMPVDMPSNFITATPSFWQNVKALGLQAGQSVGRLVRDPLFRAYLAGHTIVDSVAGVDLAVTTLNGFAVSIDPETGFPVNVSSAAPRGFSVNGTLSASRIIGATPLSADDPNGPGVLTLDVAAGINAGDRIDALDASKVIRPGNVPTVDSIGPTSTLTMELIQIAIASLRADGVPPMADGRYHVHLDPFAEQSLFLDNQLQRQIQNRGIADEPYLTFSLGVTSAATFFSNNESPVLETVDPDLVSAGRPLTAPLARTSGDIGAEVINAGGTPIGRTIVCGAGHIFEKALNETVYMSEAGVSGKVGGFAVRNNGVDIDLDGIRLILNAPTDMFAERLEVAWSISTSFTAPTDRLTGRSAAAYKRCRVIEHRQTGG
jgi:hypothetical protein